MFSINSKGNLEFHSIYSSHIYVFRFKYQMSHSLRASLGAHCSIKGNLLNLPIGKITNNNYIELVGYSALPISSTSAVC